MARVDAAEKEASEVLHSLLSVERIEKPEQVIVVTTPNESQSPAQTFQTEPNHAGEGVEGDTQLQWHTPVSIATQSLFTAINEANNHFPQSMEEQQVIWEGHTIQVGDEEHMNTLYTNSPNQTAVEPPAKKTPPKLNKLKPKKKGGGIIKKKRKIIVGNNDLSKIEDSAVQVKERFRRGCECQDESCFRGLSPESVYKHRLNIAELTKGEHDMYLMGVTMACLANPETTVRHKERRRLRAQYVYQGRRVCLDAFLYLENCTHYQLKRIRKHVMTHGVAPRVHGNHGKKPHNTFSLDIYRHATEFLKQYLESHTGDSTMSNTKQIIQLPWDITRKNLHDAYKEYGQILEPSLKLMGYSTFRHFMKEQFPNVRFCKIEPKSAVAQAQVNSNDVQQQAQEVHLSNKQNQTHIVDVRTKSVVSGDVQQVIPLVVTQGTNESNVQQQHHQQATFLVTPVPQLMPNGNLVSAQNAGNHVSTNSAAFSYQLTNAGYVISEQGNIVTTMANPQHSSYTFNRM